MSLAALAPDEFAALDALLAEALERPADQREAWLRSRCADAPQRLPLLLGLLRRCDVPSRWERALDSDAMRTLIADAADDALDPGVDAPAFCGSWRVLRRIGRGGMADVFLGEREQSGALQRAAIKLLRTSAGAGHGLRFEQERRILARLDDPRIARLLDGGVGADGRPWIAMEYVDGERIDAWCDARRLDLAARMRLLREVAEAAHSAHRALIVHRDIKPANVLVTQHGHVKLLDFGIAKLLDPERDEDGGVEAATRTQTRALTPQYASPEQLLGEPVTVATDVYQLGLLMFELLCGARAFRSDNLVELAHVVVTSDAPVPSHALTRLGTEAAEEAAALRHTTASRLRRQLRGDLDAIAQCALARVPSQRYASALRFADDLSAWHAQHPVSARAPSLAYRVQRFVSRNWLTSAVAGLLLLVLIAYVVTVQMQSLRIQREAELNRQVRDYLVQLLQEADPLRSGTPQPSAERVLDLGLENARERFAAQPQLLAELLKIGSEVKVRHGDYARGAQLIGEAVALKREGGENDPHLTELMARQGLALHYTSRYAESEAVLREAEARWYAQGAMGTPWIPMALADVLHSRGDYAAAESVLRRAQAAQQASNAPALGRAEVQRDLGVVLRDAGRLDEGRALIEAALADMIDRVGAEHGSTAVTRAVLARTLALAAEGGAARVQGQAAYDTQSRYYGEDSAVFGINRHTLALADEADGRIDAALATLDDVLARNYARVTPGNVLLAYAHLDRAWLRLCRTRDAEAAQDLDAAEATLRDIRQGGHPRWAELLLARAVIAAHRGDIAAARAAIARAIALRSDALGASHPITRGTRNWLALIDDTPPPPMPAGALPLESLRLERILATNAD
jgi:serine/threonine protein kinase